jgi:hypothetical protein
MAKFSGLELLREDSEPREETPVPRAPGTDSPKAVSRPLGKRQNPNYTQISAYVKKADYDAVKRKLVGTKFDFSDLLEKWIEEWLKATEPEIPK